jgi:carbonic anhydrase
MTPNYLKLLEENKRWAERTQEISPEYFQKLATDQNPEFLWIGCADSRAPADLLTNTQPGQIFVHRNVANLVIHTDLNMLSVLQYAVEVLKVKHIMVVGHTGCGGVKAAMGNKDLGLINKWLRSIKDTYAKYEEKLEAIEDEEERIFELTKLNIVEQVRNLAKTTIVQHAWNHGEEIYLHGWLLNLNTGLIESILDVNPGDTSFIERVFRVEKRPLDSDNPTTPHSMLL